MYLDRSGVRRLLADIFKTNAEIDSFCLDYFDEVHLGFTGDMDHSAKINRLVHLVQIEQIVNVLRQIDNAAVDAFERAR